jgi:hypothetical protein
MLKRLIIAAHLTCRSLSILGFMNDYEANTNYHSRQWNTNSSADTARYGYQLQKVPLRCRRRGLRSNHQLPKNHARGFPSVEYGNQRRL